MLKLVQITCADWGAVGKITEQLGQLAIQQGWESYIANGRRLINGSKSNIIKIGNKFDGLNHLLKTRLTDAHGLGSVHATKKLVETLDSIKPDLIHLHQIHGYYINYKILFEYLAQIQTPIVWTVHDCWAITGHCTYFEEAECKKWMRECGDCPLLSAYPKTLFRDRSTANFRTKKEVFSKLTNLTLVPVSQWMQQVMKSSFLKDKAMRMIYNGIDLSVFKPYPRRESTKVRLLAVASVWKKFKGMGDIFKLGALLGTARYEITMVGLTKRQIEDLPPYIIGKPRTGTQIELAQYYSNADIILNLSYQESFGMTTVEGLACGTPGISYNVTASPELLTNETGIIVEPGDMEGIKRAVETIAARGKAFYAGNCRQRAELYFDKNKNFLKYMELYQELVAQSRD